ncbi:hypothetical protein [Sphingomonas solaris]|uniref:Uncharacterized protein n=1 Tax=Alterirhizorhabdus solaris TaxID=2529389 RepID=A0A558RBW7_9SPHN|nr:hypothetical protein [Sphingomonas solaris]TVV76828.1 hypothetical protein FOY91_02885 [Sphingomonas solaris]
MADIDGAWDCATASPMGEQKMVLTVKRDGDRFTGDLTGALGSLPVTDGQVSGDTLTFSMEVTMPFPIRIACQATITGDTLAGTATVGAFGSYPMTGTRKA